jgi:hypothetical protein
MIPTLSFHAIRQPSQPPPITLVLAPQPTQLVIEFPPGSTILIPSSILSHSNTAVDDQEHRYSFTQYAAGGLFRWVDNGFRTLDSPLKNKLSVGL